MTFEELARRLRVEGGEESPSEIHGLLSGRIAGGERLDGETLGPALVESLEGGQELVENAIDLLRQLYASIVTAFENTDFSFRPLLPGDDCALQDRVIALSQWCQYFLSGLGDSGFKGRGFKGQSRFSADAMDAINDIAAIAQVGFEGDGEDDDEADLFELEEHVRMAAMVIFNELNGPPAASAPSQTLH